MCVYWSWPQAIRLTDKQLLCSNQTIFAQLTQVTFDHSIYTLYFLRGIALINTSKKEDAKQTTNTSTTLQRFTSAPVQIYTLLGEEPGPVSQCM